MEDSQKGAILLFNHKDRRQQRKKNELQLTAEAYYETVSPDIQAKAYGFFREMDKDKDQKINFDEYISYMKQLKGCEKMANYNFFKELNESGSGQLNLVEVITLFYIIVSRRPFCDGCNIFMDGLFFTCHECFNGRDDTTFDVCLSCFKTKNYSHKHKNFLDNYALLESKRRIEALMDKQRQTNYEAQPSTSTSTAIVPYDLPKRNRWLPVTVALTGIAATVTGVIASCSIM